MLCGYVLKNLPDNKDKNGNKYLVWTESKDDRSGGADTMCAIAHEDDTTDTIQTIWG